MTADQAGADVAREIGVGVVIIVQLTDGVRKRQHLAPHVVEVELDIPGEVRLLYRVDA